ncbi:NfeD family protein [Salinicoccus halodurans]|nr:NfeD family protein [Salinicoccus halodurans]SFK58477.1 NfeD-like C-terminal, partner-binding [Salinicoccus halodurans]
MAVIPTFIHTFQFGSILADFRDVVTMPWVAFILLAIFFLGLIYQLFSEHVSSIGLLSILSIIVFYSGHLLISDYSGISLVLFIIGTIFIIVEFFIIGAILGIIGSIMLLISILLVGNNVALFSLFLLAIIILAIIEWVILVKFKKRKIPFLNKFILTDATDAESGYTSFDDRSYLVGEQAETATALRPSGIIRYGDERIDAVAEGAFIESGNIVKIIHVEGTRVVVRPLED